MLSYFEVKWLSEPLCLRFLTLIKQRFSERMIQIGILADCQYANLPDQHQEGRTQRFRQVPGKLEAALEEMASCDYIMHLGDIIQSQESEKVTENEFDLICGIFEKNAASAIHVLGNHCIQKLSREHVMERLRIPCPGYYRVDVSPRWSVIVLDTTEMSGHSGFPEDDERSLEAKEFLRSHPCSDEDPHMVFWNGGITQCQHEWLISQLRSLKEAGRLAVVVAHHQCCLGAARSTHLAWNYKTIFNTLSNKDYSEVVRLFLAGHDHIGGGVSRVDMKGGSQAFITIPAILESPDDSNAFAILSLYDDENGEEIKAAPRGYSLAGYGHRCQQILQQTMAFSS